MVEDPVNVPGGRGRKPRSPRLVGVFAVGSFATFLAIGAILTFVAVRYIQQRELQRAQQHAIFVADSLVQYKVAGESLTRPFKGARLRRFQRFATTRLLQFPIVRVKIWSNDGTVVYSDERRLIGKSFEVEGGLDRALQGETVSFASELDQPENPYERRMAGKLLETYVPLYLPGDGNGAPSGVVEVYQDYASVQAAIDKLLRILVPALLIGLAVLYVLQLPLARRIEQELSKKNDQLEEQAARLETHLQRERETVTKLEELNRLKGEFVDVASHELRNPLAAIAAAIKTLLRPEASDLSLRDEVLHLADKQVDRLMGLTDRLLLSERLENGRFHLSITEFRVDDLVNDLIAGLGDRADRVEVDLPRDLPMIQSDRQGVQEILTNLVENALKFSPEASPCEIHVWSTDQALSFSVRDQGPGIPKESRHQIFERFHRVDSTSTRSQPGVGLGLSLVKELLDQLHGRIRVSTRAGEGSEFTITLPVRYPIVIVSGERPTASVDRGVG